MGRRLACILILLAVAAGCSHPPGDPGRTIEAPAPGAPVPPARIAMIGDSLIDCCDEVWETGELASEHPLEIWSVGATLLNRTRGEWVSALDPRPTVLVVAMGTNNAGDGWGADDQDALDHMLDVDAADVPCVVLVNLGFGPTAKDPYPAGVAEVNRAYAAAASAQPDRVTVADWRGPSSDEPGWFDRDGIHHSPQGQPRYVAIITQATQDAIATRRCGDRPS